MKYFFTFFLLQISFLSFSNISTNNYSNDSAPNSGTEDKTVKNKKTFDDCMASTRAKLDGLSNISEKISEASEKVKNNSLYQTFIDGKALEFPMGVLPPNVPKDYALIVNSIEVTATGTYAEIYLQLPIRDKILQFMAVNVPVGTSMEEELYLYLVNTQSIKVGQKGYSLSFFGLDSIKNDQLTYISFTCKGFNEISINGNINFDPESISAYDSLALDNPSPKKPFRIDYYVRAKNLSEFVIDVKNIPPFQLSSNPGFKCEVSAFTLDFSSQFNASETFSLPQFYVDYVTAKNPNSPNLASLTGTEWEGVYIPEIIMTIPRRFTEGKTPKPPVTINLANVIIDHYGVTVQALARDVLTYDKNNGGDMNGFKFSLDSVRVNVTANALTKAGFYGLMTIPINKQETSSSLEFGLTYTNQPNEGYTYSGYGNFYPDKPLEVEAFDVAQMTLSAAELDFTIKSKKFYVKATLSGALKISGRKKEDIEGNVSEEKSGGLLVGVNFQRLVVESTAPYLSVGQGGYVDILIGDNLQSAMNKMPLQINSVKFLSQDNRRGFGIDVSVQLNGSKSGNSSGNGFQARTYCEIWTKREEVSAKYKYDGFEVRTLELHVKQGAFSLDGSLSTFSNDPIYKKGICGFIEVEIIEKFKASAAVIFGKYSSTPVSDASQLTASQGATATTEELDNQSEYRYWFVDFQATFPGIPIFAGVDLNSVSGGLYKNMVMSMPGTSNTDGSNVVCKSASGREYTPEAGIFGIMAGIGIQSTGGGQAYNGRINLGLEFYIPTGGIMKIATWGDVKFLSGAPNVDQASLSSKAASAKSIPSKQESQATPPGTSEEESGETGPAMLDWFVAYDFPNKTLVGDFNVYINMSVIKGRMNEAGKAGNISVFASPDYWYLYIGQPKPDLMVGVKVLDNIDIGAYICMGTKLPDPAIAPMPDRFKNIAISASDMLGLGSGFSFGGRLSLGGGDNKNILFFKLDYGFSVQAGFDLLIAKSDKEIICDDVGVRGIKNWYALGQAFILGKAWAKAKTKFASANLASIELGAGIAGGAPKPAFFAGIVYADCRVFGVGFSLDVEFEFGKRCDAIGNESTLSFFTTNYPYHEQSKVSVYTPINVGLKYDLLDYEFKYGGNDKYRFNVRKDLISVVANNKPIDFKFEIGSDSRSFEIIPLEILPESTVINVTCNIYFEKYSNSAWREEPSLKGIPLVFSFTTDSEPILIPNENITYSYPYPQMENFYILESRKGYVKFNANPIKATTLTTNQEFVVAIYNSSNQLVEKNNSVLVNTNLSNNYFEFDIPIALLEPNMSYELRILRSEIGNNSSQQVGTLGNVGYGTTTTQNPDIVVLKVPFQTSIYRNFRDKLASYQSSNSSFTGAYMDVSYSLQNGESMSDLELYGTSSFQPLFQISKVDYNNSTVNNAISQLSTTYQSLTSIQSFSIASIQNGIQIVSNQIDSFKDILEQQNLQCLTNGNCTSNDLAKATIPAGKVNLEVNYYLPGQLTPNSTNTMEINLDRSIKL